MNEKIQELKDKIDDLRSKIFYNNMCDHWSDANYKYDRECKAELREAEEELEALLSEDDLR